jgi:transcription elongation factor Elf1
MQKKEYKTYYCASCSRKVISLEKNAGNMALQHIVIRCGTCENRLQKRLNASVSDDDISSLLGNSNKSDDSISSLFNSIFNSSTFKK